MTDDNQSVLDAALLLAVSCNSRPDVQRLLARGANPNAFQTESSNTFIEALRAARFDLLQDMLAHGADVNAQREKGRTPPPLMAAAVRDVMEGSDARTRFLLAQGADTAIVFRFTAGDCGVREALGEFSRICTPKERQQVQAIIRLIDQHAARPNVAARREGLRRQKQGGRFKL